MKKALTVLMLGALFPLCAQNDNLRFGVQTLTTVPIGRLNEIKYSFRPKFKTLEAPYVSFLPKYRSYVDKNPTTGVSSGLNAFAKYDMGCGHGLVANLGIEKFRDKKVYFSAYTRNMGDASKKCVGAAGHDVLDPNHCAAGYKWKHKRSSCSIGVDYTYHINKTQDGFYVLAGAGMECFRTKSFPIVDIFINHINNDVCNLLPSDVSEIEARKVKFKHKTKPRYSVGIGYDFSDQLGAQIRYNAHYEKLVQDVMNHKNINKFKNLPTLDKGIMNKMMCAVTIGVTYTF